MMDVHLKVALGPAGRWRAGGGQQQQQQQQQ